MYPKYLCRLGCLGAFLLPILYALPSVPSNSSIMKTGLGNHTLSAWPPHTGWKIHVGDLTIVFKRYGRLVEEAQWRQIREALNDFRRRFLYNDALRVPPPHLKSDEYASDNVKIEIFGTTPIPGSNYLSGKKVAQVLSTINGLFFDPGGKPRQLLVEITKPTLTQPLWLSFGKC